MDRSIFEISMFYCFRILIILQALVTTISLDLSIRPKARVRKNDVLGLN